MRAGSWAIPLGCLLLSVLITSGLTGCSSDKSTNSGGTGAATGEYLIDAYFSKTTESFATFRASVIRLEPSDAPANDARVYINGDQVQQTPIISTAEEAFYATMSFDYEVGEDYAVEVTLGSRTATCTFTAPAWEWPEITAPAGNSSYVPGQTLNVGWTYGGSMPEKVIVTAYGEGGDAEEDFEYQVELSGSATTHAIPASETTTWSTFDEVFITVDLGASAWGFTGNLASPGSYVATVLKGDAISITNAATAQWYIDVATDAYELAADGVSTTTVTVTVTGTGGTFPPDGSEVSFTLDPAGLASVSPAVTSTTSGVATTIFTAGTAPGTVTITAACRGSEGFNSIELVESTTQSYTITVGTGTNPTS